jgi:hypothetical protein
VQVLWTSITNEHTRGQPRVIRVQQGDGCIGRCAGSKQQLALSNGVSAHVRHAFNSLGATRRRRAADGRCALAPSPCHRCVCACARAAQPQPQQARHDSTLQQLSLVFAGSSNGG